MRSALITLAMAAMLVGGGGRAFASSHASLDLLSYAERCMFDSKKWADLQNHAGAAELKAFLDEHHQQSRKRGVAFLRIDDDGKAVFMQVNSLATTPSSPGWERNQGNAVASLLEEFAASARKVDGARNAYYKGNEEIDLKQGARELKEIFDDPFVPVDVAVDLVRRWKEAFGKPGQRALRMVDKAVDNLGGPRRLKHLGRKLDPEKLDGRFSAGWNVRVRKVDRRLQP